MCYYKTSKYIFQKLVRTISLTHSLLSSDKDSTSWVFVVDWIFNFKPVSLYLYRLKYYIFVLNKQSITFKHICSVNIFL